MRVILNFILLFFVTMGYALADTNGIWTYAEDVVPGTFGSDEGYGPFTFNGVVNFLLPVNLKSNFEIGSNLTVNGTSIFRGEVVIQGRPYYKQVSTYSFFSLPSNRCPCDNDINSYECGNSFYANNLSVPTCYDVIHKYTSSFFDITITRYIVKKYLYYTPGNVTINGGSIRADNVIVNKLNSDDLTVNGTSVFNDRVTIKGGRPFYIFSGEKSSAGGYIIYSKRCPCDHKTYLWECGDKFYADNFSLPYCYDYYQSSSVSKAKIYKLVTSDSDNYNVSIEEGSIVVNDGGVKSVVTDNSIPAIKGVTKSDTGYSGYFNGGNFEVNSNRKIILGIDGPYNESGSRSIILGTGGGSKKILIGGDLSDPIYIITRNGISVTSSSTMAEGLTKGAYISFRSGYVSNPPAVPELGLNKDYELDVKGSNLTVEENLKVEGGIIKTNWENAHFYLGENGCSFAGHNAACYPNKRTADAICRSKGYLYSTYFTSASDCCGWCADFRGYSWYVWDCGDGGDQHKIEHLYCVR